MQILWRLLLFIIFLLSLNKCASYNVQDTDSLHMRIWLFLLSISKVLTFIHLFVVNDKQFSMLRWLQMLNTSGVLLYSNTPTIYEYSPSANNDTKIKCSYWPFPVSTIEIEHKSSFPNHNLIIKSL